MLRKVELMSKLHVFGSLGRFPCERVVLLTGCFNSFQETNKQSTVCSPSNVISSDVSIFLCLISQTLSRKKAKKYYI